MSAEVSFEVTKIPDFSKMAQVIRDGVRKEFLGWGNDYLSLLVKTRMSGAPGVNRRTGNLSRDWVVEDSSTNDGASVTVKSQGAANAYAGMLERGGTITPKKAKALWIPLPGNLDGRGVARLTPTQAWQAGGFIRDGVFYRKPIIKSQAKGMGPHIVPLFVLRRSVTIKPMLGATALFQSRLPALKEAITEVIAKAAA